MHYKFIDIGCGHTNVSVDVYGSDVLGLLVDPIREFCNVLPKSDTVSVECAAVTDYDGELDMNITSLDMSNVKYIPISMLTNDKHLPRLLRAGKIFGTESINVRSHLGVKRTVNCMRLDTLLNKYGITEVDQLKIDVEGHENVVLSQLIDLMRRGRFKVNERIIFEYNHLSDKPELDKLANIITTEFGYTSVFQVLGWNEDIILTKI